MPLVNLRQAEILKLPREIRRRLLAESCEKWSQRSRSTEPSEPAGEPGLKPGGEFLAMLPPIPPKRVRRAVLTVEQDQLGMDTACGYEVLTTVPRPLKFKMTV